MQLQSKFGEIYEGTQINFSVNCVCVRLKQTKYQLDFMNFFQRRICRPPNPLLSFAPILMEDVQCAETNEK